MSNSNFTPPFTEHEKRITRTKLGLKTRELGQIYKFISYAIKPFKFYLIVISFMVLVQTTLGCFRELSVKFIIDKIGNVNTKTLGFIWVIILVCNDFIIESSYRISDKFNYYYRPLIKQHIAKILLKQMIGYDYHFYQDKNPAELATSVMNVFDGVEDCIMIVFDNFLNFILLMFITSAYALMVNAKIALLLLLWGIIWLIVSIYVGGRMYVLTHAYSRSEVELEANMSDLFSHIFTVYSSNNDQHELKKLHTWTNKMVKAENNLRNMQFKFWMIQGFIFCGVNGLILFYTVHLYTKQLVTLGDISFIFGLVINLYMQLWTLAKDVREFTDAIGRIGQGIKLIDMSKFTLDSESEKNIQITFGKIRFANISFGYPQFNIEDQDPLFNGDVSFTINPGEFVGFVGSSGSGKSTLFKLILRICELNGGKILIDNQDISTVNLHSLRSKIAVIPQDAGIFMHRSIAENIGYGTFDEIDQNAKEQIISAAKKTNAHEFIMRLPEQYETVLSEYGINLSGGQKQRIAIARGFVKSASIFLFDEATSALDNITQSKVQKQIRELVKGKTTLVIAHRLHAIKDADRIFVFEKGSLIQQGKHDELLNQEGLYKKMWNAQ